MEIAPQNVDVNVHPTKHEVRFLHEEAIIEKIKFTLDEKLATNDASRTFYIQAKLPKVDVTKEIMDEVFPITQAETDKDKTKKIHPKDMIRTSSSDQKLDKFNFTSEIANKSNLNNTVLEKNKGTEKVTEVEISNKNDTRISNITQEDNDNGLDNEKNEVKTTKDSNIVVEILENNAGCSTSKDDTKTDSKANKTSSTSSQKNETPVDFKSYSVNEVRIECKLMSILTLKKEIEDSYHEGLREIISNLIFVGCVDECSALIQSGVSLYICNTQKLV